MILTRKGAVTRDYKSAILSGKLALLKNPNTLHFVKESALCIEEVGPALKSKVCGRGS